MKRHADGEEWRLVERTYGEQDAGAPDKGEQVEDAELARLVELAVFGLGEVLLSVDFLQMCTSVSNTALVIMVRLRARVSNTYVQHVLLDDGVHDDGHQHVEEDGGQVLDAVVEVVHGRLVRT